MQFKESEIIELKKSTSQLDNSLEDVCAFCNHKGGALYFGINNDGKIIGQDISDSTLKSVAQKILQKIKPEIQPEIKEIIIDGKNIIEVNIKEGQNKPYFLNGVAYKRIGSETKAMTFEELRRSAFESVASEWETQICKGATIKDINMKTVNYFLKLVKESKRLNINDKDKLRILKKLELIKDNKITNACILLFGKEPVKFDSIFSVRARRLRGESTIIDMKDFNGNLFENLKDTINFIESHIRLEAKIEGLFRKERWEIPIEALREIVLNAFIHRYYTSNSQTYIDIQDNEILIYNPGYLPESLKISDLYKTHDSKPRNKLIAQIVYYTGLIDKWGQGTLKVTNQLLKEGLSKPIFEQSMGTFWVKFKRSNSEHKIKIVDKINVSDRLVEGLVEGLVESQKRILELISQNSKISKQDLSKIIGISETAIDKNILTLKKKNLLERIGPNKGGYWQIKGFVLGHSRLGKDKLGEK